MTEKFTSKLVINNPKYFCAKHGDIENNIFESFMEGNKGTWCLKCIVELIDKHCCRVKKIEKPVVEFKPEKK